MSLTSKIVLVHFLALITGVCRGDTLVSRLPTTAIEASYTEELWVYLPKLVPSGNLYIFYQQHASEIKLTASNVELKFLYYEPPSDVSTSPVLRSGIGSLGGVIELNRWMHIAVIKDLKLTAPASSNAVIYVNNKSSSNIVLPLGLPRVSFKTTDRDWIARST